MELEELTKTQMIMLTSLISFVTSIATGIITVSLMNEAPPIITQTIQKVVEKTIEKVIPGGDSAVVEKVITTVQDEEKLIKIVDDNTKSLMRIGKNLREDNQTTFVAMGFAFTQDGIIITDGNLIEPDGSYYVTTYDNKVFPLEIINFDHDKGIAFMRAVINEEVLFTSAKLGNSESLKLGQKVITVSGERSDEVSTGIVSNFVSKDNVVSKIKTNLNLKDDASGSPLIDYNGEVVGINIVNQDESFAVPIDNIRVGL